MASYYVWSAAAGTGTGASWANAFTTLTAALSGKTAGDTFYVAHDHAESSASAIGLDGIGFNAGSNPTKIICVNRLGTVPPVSADRRATAQISTTGNANITLASVTHYDGIIFTAGNSTGAPVILILPSNNHNSMRLDNCSLRLGSSGPGSIKLIDDSAKGTRLDLNNTTVSFANAAQTLLVASMVKWRNTPSAVLGTAPTTLFTEYFGYPVNLECIGVDLSTVTGTLCGNNANAVTSTFRFVDCKLNASVTKAVSPSGPGTSEISAVRSGAAGANYAVYQQNWYGVLTEEITIVRTGGASDGTTPISWKIITASTAYSRPFECPPIVIWNDIVGSARIATIEGVWGGGAVPLDSEIWVDVEYLSDASSPQGAFANDGTPDLLATPANQAASSATWGGSTTKFKLEVTFTAQQRGWIYARVKCAKPSSTFYIDPLVTLS